MFVELVHGYHFSRQLIWQRCTVHYNRIIIRIHGAKLHKKDGNGQLLQMRKGQKSEAVTKNRIFRFLKILKLINWMPLG